MPAWAWTDLGSENQVQVQVGLQNLAKLNPCSYAIEMPVK